MPYEYKTMDPRTLTRKQEQELSKAGWKVLTISYCQMLLERIKPSKRNEVK